MLPDPFRTSESDAMDEAASDEYFLGCWNELCSESFSRPPISSLSSRGDGGAEAGTVKVGNSLDVWSSVI